MKIGLVIPANIKYSPYVNYYIDILKRENVDYRLLVWDKVGIDEDADMTYRYKSSDFDRKRILAGHYLFARRCRAFIREEKIDHLIVFTIAPLFFLGYRFLSHFRGDIIIDIRDDSPFRRNFKKQLDKICQLAENVIVSSPYYAKWLSRKCIQCHNADMEMLRKYRTVDDKKVIRKPFRLVYAGMMIEEDANIQLIQQLGNKEEFVMTYVGRDNPGKDKIRQYVQEKNIANVYFEGEYKKEDIVDIYREKADYANIIRQKTLINRNALPNKLYDAVFSGVPVIVYDHNKAISHYVIKYSLGIVLNEQSDVTDQLLTKAPEFDYEAYRSGRELFMRKIEADYHVFEKSIKQFCKNNQ